MATPGSGDASSNPRPVAGGRGSMLNLRAPGRLPTMRSRDLTLGGVKKKTFTPNIIGRKSKEELKVNEGPRRERGNADRGRQRDGRGRGRGRPEVIQSHSIFEQGPAEMMAKRRAGAYEDTRDTPNSAPCPIINIKKEYRETEEETKEILRKLESDRFVDDPQLRNEARCCPVQLPLAVSGWVFKEEVEDDADVGGVKVEKCEEDEKMSTESSGTAFTVKQEPPDVPVMKKAEPMFKSPPLPEPDLLPDLLQAWSRCKEEEFLFMQLPDSLPGQPPTSDARPTKTTVQSEDGQNMLQKAEGQQEEAEEENSCHLRELQEGVVGRMLVRKSGRVQLVLGDITLDVSLGTSCSFLQELVSVSTEGRRGDMTVLGHVEHKLVCSPDFEALLQNRA
ncbi:DNA-directed RNA polymerase III subunit RPC4 isoform X1 [Ictalurus furcatus]|uniref:DNA-directed RNA polymerase III subunit RPC4 isoform X1 n=1 Tax=Ictalurus furcatus TaxID=66913 RepID=UPI00234FEBFA|nr:DNA-directed RNA polymerase III subunit RPC4 isoform X1 [Ictalurus furcatus]XP_053482015.1 DNA-directed RNA polymerase III subunit RPC4 isoform X1 [Ictalurus furcatus]